MAIRIKRSSGNTAPSVLDSGQLAYVEGSSNGGTLYYGEIGGTVRVIGGRKFVDKLDGIEAGAQVNTVDSVNGQTGAVSLAVGDISGAEATANKGQANGYASLDSAGLVPSSQLPSYVDDVVEYANLAGFPATGESAKIYVAVDTGKTYRWSGSTYVEISASPGSTDAVTEGSTNLYYTDARARAALSASQNLSYNSSTGAFTGPDLSGYATSASLATVATSGSYNDLSDKPSLFSGAYADLTGKPTLFSGSYTDLTDKPTLFSGSYTDLTDKPTIPADLLDLGITDGTSGQVLTTDGAGNFSFTTVSSGGLQDVIDDTTPQLGGDLDVNGKKFVTVSNGAITLAPNGSGNILLNESGTGLVVARRTTATGTSTNAMFVQRNYTADVLANMDGHTAGLVFSQRDSANATTFYTRLAGEYATDGQHAHWFEKSTNNGTSWTRQATLSDAAFIMGALTGTTTQQIGTYGVQNLVLGTNAVNGGTGGLIYIDAGANGGIQLSPNGTGVVEISGLSYPVADGTSGQFLTTNGSGVLSFADVDDGTF